MQLDDVLGQPFGQPRLERHLVRAGGEHDMVGGQFAGRRREPEPAARQLPQPRRLDALVQRDVELLHVRLEVGDDLVPDHEPVRIVARVREPRQTTLPIRRDQAETVPAAGPPFVPRALAFEHQVPDPGGGETVGHRQSRLAAADHDHRPMQAVELEVHADQSTGEPFPNGFIRNTGALPDRPGVTTFPSAA